MIYPAGRYNLNFDICAIIICILMILYLVIGQNLRVRRIRAFFGVVLGMLVCSSGELAMDIVRNDNGITFSNRTAEAVTFLSHITHNSIPFLLILYFLSITSIWHGLKKHDFILISIPEIILVVSHLIPPIRHFIYYYQGNLEYIRQPLYSLYYIIVGFYVIYGISIIVKNHALIEKHNILYISILCTGFLLGMLVGMIDKYLRMTNFIQVLTLSSAFYLLENNTSYLDKVTGVYNSAALNRDTYPLFHSSYQSYLISIKLQDINNYRLMVGMNAMNQIFKQIGSWMLGIANENCHFYRVAPAEFSVLLYNADAKRANEAAEKIRTRFTKPWHYSNTDTDITIPVQIWISSIPDRISTEEQALAFSEKPYDANLPQNQIYFADEIKDEKRQTDVNIAIQRALTYNTFDVYYQPIYDSTTNTIHSCEALIRMTDPQLGPVSPEEFIKVAEHNGTVSMIGSIVFEKVCQFLSESKPEQYGMDFVEVNLSTIQCMDQNLPEKFNAIMKKYGVQPGQIVLEITESAIISNEGLVSSIIQRLEHEGFRFALDDFGTGLANYSYIRKFPFSIIKIDKSFLWAADKDLDDRAVLRNMFSLVNDLNLNAVVEGVETEAQRNGLVRDGVKYLQGYYYSKPVPADQFLSYIRKFNHKDI